MAKSAKPDQVHVRLGPREFRILREILAYLRDEFPSARWTRSDAIRHAISQWGKK